MTTCEALSEHQMDAFRELGNIGSGHAATSLSMMIGQEIEMRVPDLEVMPLQSMRAYLHFDRPAVGLYFQLLDLDSRPNGHIYLIIPEDSALKISDILLMRDAGATKTIMDDEQSALTEVGNILISSFGDASAELLGMTILPSPPTYGFGPVPELIDSIAARVGAASQRAIIFKTSMYDIAREVSSFIIMLPEPETLDSILGLLEAKANE